MGYIEKCLFLNLSTPPSKMCNVFFIYDFLPNAKLCRDASDQRS